MTLRDSTLNFIAQYTPNLKKGAELLLKLPDKEYTIDELARAAESTTRNIRAYQDRGLLPPPTKAGVEAE